MNIPFRVRLFKSTDDVIRGKYFIEYRVALDVKKSVREQIENMLADFKEPRATYQCSYGKYLLGSKATLEKFNVKEEDVIECLVGPPLPPKAEVLWE